MFTNQSYRFTKTELKQLLDSFVILIDTREKKIDHITSYFDKINIDYKFKKLEYGDYSFYLPVNKKLGVMQDIYFNDSIAIERKASLEELSVNFTHERDRFENEIIRSKGCKLTLLIEDNNYSDIVFQKYNTKFNPNAFIGSLFAFSSRYNLSINFIKKELTGDWIYNTFYYFLRSHLKNKEC